VDVVDQGGCTTDQRQGSSIEELKSIGGTTMKSMLKKLIVGLLLVAATSEARAEDFEKDIQASIPEWQNAGVDVPPGFVAVITAKGGWTANPAWGKLVGAGGNPEFKAKRTYALEGANEGALLLKLGNGEVIAFTRDDESIKVTTPGKLLFLCNDEPTQFGYGKSSFTIFNLDLGAANTDGAGFQDNSGALRIRISVRKIE
jgi:hypothetical protein